MIDASLRGANVTKQSLDCRARLYSLAMTDIKIQKYHSCEGRTLFSLNFAWMKWVYGGGA